MVILDSLVLLLIGRGIRLGLKSKSEKDERFNVDLLFRLNIPADREVIRLGNSTILGINEFTDCPVVEARVLDLLQRVNLPGDDLGSLEHGEEDDVVDEAE